jgi:hypothetical protein
MKKICGLLIMLLMSALFMFGCNGGGNNTTNQANPSGGNTGGGDNPTADGGNNTTADVTPANAGYLVINFDEGQTHMKAAGSSLPTPDKVRVVVRQRSSSTVTTSETDGQGDPIPGTETSTTVWTTTYKQIVDLVVPGSATIPVTQGTGYLVDIISYQAGSSRNVMLKYGNAQNIDIVSGQSTTVPIVLSPINATITTPASIDSGSAYMATANNNVFPLRSDKKNLRVSTTGTISDLFDYSSSFTSFQVTAPILAPTDSPKTIYCQGLFFIDDELLDPVKNPATDVWSKWTYYYPNPNFSDPAVSATVTPPGAISINVTL